MVYHLGEHKCHDKLYVPKNHGPGTEQSLTSLHSIPAKKKAIKNVAQKKSEGDMDGVEQELVVYLQQRTSQLN